MLEGGAGAILGTQGVTTQLRTLLPLFRDHPEITELLGKKARERVLERYTFHENINRLEKLYTNLLQSYNKSLVLNHF